MTEAVKERTGFIIAYRFFYAFVLGLMVYGYVRNACDFQGKLFVHLTVLIFGLFLLAVLDCFIGRGAYLVTGILLTAAAVRNVVFKVIDTVSLTKEQKEALFGPENIRELWCVYLIAAAVLTIWILLEDRMILKAISAAAVTGALVIAMVMGHDLPKLSVSMAFVYMVSNLLELLERYWEKKRNGSRRMYFVRIMPFIVLYFVLMAVLPSRSAPYDWSITRNIFRRVQENFYRAVQNIPIGIGEDFDISTTGFSDGSNFFGDLVNSEKEVLHLKKNASFDKAVYLTGRVYDTFDGRSWKNTFETKRKDVRFDALEIFYAAYQYDSEHRQDYIRKAELEVEYRFFHTQYLFTPLKTLEITGAEAGKDYDARDGWYRFHKRKNFSTQYKAEYYVMNRNHPDFIKMIEEISGARPEDAEKIWNRVLKKHNMVSGVLRYEDLQDYRRRMQAYRMAPEMSGAAKEWLYEVCEKAGSDYERMMRIEEALRGFSYTSHPGKLPDDIDTEKEYLDYFLLEKKAGYCSYFATSFVLLAREMGMPARLAEGYCVRGTSGSKTGSALEQEVMSDMAHAWPEVYFEGVGWIPFEPTPGFSDYRNTSWKTSGDLLREKEAAGMDSVETEDIRHKESVYDDDDEEDYEEIVQEEDPFVYEFVMFLVYLMAGAAAIFILFIAGDAVLEKVHTGKMDEMAKISREFRRNMQILEALGYRRAEAETLDEFNRRLPKEEDFINLYEAVFYGKREADGSLFRNMADAGQALLAKLRKEKGIKYGFARCLLYLRRAR